MSGQHYDTSQGVVPPPPAPSQNPTPPPPPSPQNVVVPAVAVLQAGVTFTPMSEKNHCRIKHIIMGVVALVVFGVVATIALAVTNWTHAPEAQARQYPDLLADGRTSAVTAIVDPGLPNDQRDFLSGEVMASSSARIEVESATMDDVEHSEERVVTATIRLSSEHFTRSFRVGEAGKTFGLLKNWKIRDVMVPRVDVRAGNVTHFSIGGEKVSIAALKEVPSSSIVLYPDVCTFTPEETGKCIGAVPKTISVKAATGYDNSYYGGTVELKGTYNDEMAAAALEAAAALTNPCATVPGNIDTACPGAVQSRTLALLQARTMPAVVRATTDEGGVYIGEAAFTVQGMESWEKQHGVTSRVTATVKTDKGGKLELDAPGGPQFRIQFAY